MNVYLNKILTGFDLGALGIYNGLYETLQCLVLVLNLQAIEEREQWLIVKKINTIVSGYPHFCVPFPPQSPTFKI